MSDEEYASEDEYMHKEDMTYKETYPGKYEDVRAAIIKYLNLFHKVRISCCSS